MKVKLALAGIGILLLILAATGWHLYNKPHTGVSDINADINITADKLYNDFAKDETGANKLYLNKVIEVTGNISDIQNVNGSQIILLGSDIAIGGVSCKLGNEKPVQIIAAKKSTQVVIKGRCSGYLMDVDLVDCILK